MMDQLILKYLQDRLTLQEQHKLSKWLEEDESNREVLNRMEIFWKDQQVDLDEKERKIRNRLAHRMEEVRLQKRQDETFSYKRFLAIAAVLVIGLVGVFMASNLYRDTSAITPPVTYIQKTSMAGQKLTLTLPDGSVARLNSNSTLTAPEQFDGETRTIRLTGEAFFEVKHDPAHPFIVKTEHVEVRVLGTSFDIRTYHGELASVACATGKVAVSEPDGDLSSELVPNEMIIYNPVTRQFDRKDVDQLEVFGWKDDWLVFEKEEFNMIVKKLEDWYGVSITLDGNVPVQGKFSGRFHNNSLDKVLKGLAYVYFFDYTIEDKIVIIKPQKK